ncbi:hypothetical protein [Kutzneria sp. NPDC052558]
MTTLLDEFDLDVRLGTQAPSEGDGATKRQSLDPLGHPISAIPFCALN